jgi:hypothetical protein
MVRCLRVFSSPAIAASTHQSGGRATVGASHGAPSRGQSLVRFHRRLVPVLCVEFWPVVARTVAQHLATNGLRGRARPTAALTNHWGSEAFLPGTA